MAGHPHVFQISVFMTPDFPGLFCYNRNSAKLSAQSTLVCVMDRQGNVEYASGWDQSSSAEDGLTVQAFLTQAVEEVRKDDPRFGRQTGKR